MMSFALLLLCAVYGHTFSSTLKPLQEMNMENAVLSLIMQMSNMEEKILLLGESVEEGKRELKRVEKIYLDDKKLLEQALIKISDIEKSSHMSFDSVSDRLNVEKDKLLSMNNHLLAEVLELQKRDLETFEKIVNVESEVRMRADLLQVRLNETANMTHSCQKNVETLESNLSGRMGNAAILLEALRKDLAEGKVTVLNNTNDIGQLKQEISHIQTLCSPPCANGGQCVKNVCNCTPSFTGDSCQEAVCSPPCKNGGKCMRNNVCKCTFSFYGDRCEDRCGVEFDNGGNNGGRNNSSVLVWPWMAAVYNNKDEYICGGSVIHRHFVLTSAKCMHSYGNAVHSVKIGLSDLKNRTHLQEHRIRSVHMHPHFQGRNNNNYDYNIGLLEVEEPIHFGPFVSPVCLPPRETPQDVPLYKPQFTTKTVALDSYLRSPRTETPTVLSFTILSQEECRGKIRENDWEKFHPSPDLSFCAESFTPCPEWGSPIMQSHREEDGTRTWTQVSFSAISKDCKLLVFPRFDHLRAWVEAKIAAASHQ